MHVSISLDAVRRDTYESIRIGADFDAVMVNIERFADYAARRGTGFNLSHCLMTSNWHEFDDFLRFAQEREADVFINTVTDPHDLSLYHLHPTDLRPIVDEVDRRHRMALADLTGPRLVAWTGQRERLHRHLGELAEHRPPDYIADRRVLGFPWLCEPARSIEALAALAQSTDDALGVVVDLDVDGVVTRIDPVGPQAPGPSGEAIRAVLGDLGSGDPAPRVLVEAADRFGSVLTTDHESVEVAVAVPGRVARAVQVVRAACRDDHGIIVGARVLLDARRRFGFLWHRPPEEAREAVAWLDARAQHALGAMVHLDASGAVIDIEQIGRRSTEALDVAVRAVVDAVLGHREVGQPAPDALVGDDGPDERATTIDKASVDLPADPGGLAPDGVEVLRTARRDARGVIAGARVLIEVPEPVIPEIVPPVDPKVVADQARALATAHRPSWPLARLVLDPAGRFVEVDGDVGEIFALDPSVLLGRGVDQLDPMALLGAIDSTSAEVPAEQGVLHHVQRFRRADGSGGQLHSFFAPSDQDTTIWLVRVADGANGPIS